MRHTLMKDGSYKEFSEEHCPVCGYQCAGKGGKGCIDKPSLCGLPLFSTTDKERIIELESALREIYEVYANSDGFTPETAPEAYQQRLIDQMIEICRTALCKTGGNNNE